MYSHFRVAILYAHLQNLIVIDFLCGSNKLSLVSTLLRFDILNHAWHLTMLESCRYYDFDQLLF